MKNTSSKSDETTLQIHAVEVRLVEDADCIEIVQNNGCVEDSVVEINLIQIDLLIHVLQLAKARLAVRGVA